VYDSLLEIRQLSGDSLRFRREILGFKLFLAQQGITTLMLDTGTEYGGDSEMEGIAHASSASRNSCLSMGSPDDASK
jgi:circadian clock protein KaiC